LRVAFLAVLLRAVLLRAVVLRAAAFFLRAGARLAAAFFFRAGAFLAAALLLAGAFLAAGDTCASSACGGWFVLPVAFSATASATSLPLSAMATLPVTGNTSIPRRTGSKRCTANGRVSPRFSTSRALRGGGSPSSRKGT